MEAIMRSASEGPPKREASASWFRRGSGLVEAAVEVRAAPESVEGVEDGRVTEVLVGLDEFSTLHLRRELRPCCDILDVLVV
jgi:hypothetical protein